MHDLRELVLKFVSLKLWWLWHLLLYIYHKSHHDSTRHTVTINTTKLVVAVITEETRYFIKGMCVTSAEPPTHNLRPTILATVQFPNIHGNVAVQEAPSLVSAIPLSCASHKKNVLCFFNICVIFS